jgi:hypothetical protein
MKYNFILLLILYLVCLKCVEIQNMHQNLIGRIENAGKSFKFKIINFTLFFK